MISLEAHQALNLIGQRRHLKAKTWYLPIYYPFNFCCFICDRNVIDDSIINTETLEEHAINHLKEKNLLAFL